MERNTAERIMAILADGRELNALDGLSHDIADETERRAFRRKLGEVMGIYTDLIVSISHQHPDLDPDHPVDPPTTSP